MRSNPELQTSIANQHSLQDGREGNQKADRGFFYWHNLLKWKTEWIQKEEFFNDE